MLPDADVLYDSLSARDGRFAGLVLVCVTTTGIYCRMTCPARTPKRGNVEFRASAAECQDAGFRPCKRCTPDQMRSQPAGRSSVTAS
ncbi:MAG: Ada metal-binding domain-containing protein [Alphaproteobacteria bacterium]